VKLPVQLQRAMATEAEASRDARAKVISAEGEKNSSLFLKEASDIMSQSKGALQVKTNKLSSNSYHKLVQSNCFGHSFCVFSFTHFERYTLFS